MDKHTRQAEMLAMVAARGEVSLSEFATAFEASTVTLRRDLRELASSGRLNYARNVARSRRQSTRESSFAEKALVSSNEKQAIAEHAAHSVHDGDTIILGAGTTTYALALLLRDVSLEVWTNSLHIAEAFAQSTTVAVYVSGGELRPHTSALIGSRAEKFFSGLKANIAFVSANGFTPERGLTTPNVRVAEVDRAIAHAADEVVALVDHTKVGVDSIVTTVPSPMLTRLITDARAPQEVLKRAHARGITVTVATASASRSPQRLH